MDNNEMEMECLASKIKDVELAKKNEPEMYAKAVASLKSEAKQIMSIEDLKAKHKELTKGDQEDPVEDAKEEDDGN